MVFKYINESEIKKLVEHANRNAIMGAIATEVDEVIKEYQESIRNTEELDKLRDKYLDALIGYSVKAGLVKESDLSENSKEVMSSILKKAEDATKGHRKLKPSQIRYESPKSAKIIRDDIINDLLDDIFGKGEV